jgi:hypothetical protein
MFHFEPGSDRWKLGFKQAAIANFRFLYRYGFRRVRTEPTFVRYETVWPLSRKKLFVNVFHGRGSYVMGVEVGQKKDQGVILPLPSIVKWAGGAEAEDFEKRTMFQASSREAVQELVPKMAGLVRKYAGSFLSGDERAFNSAFEEGRRSSARYLKEMELGRARGKAEVAWHVKDYEEVVRLYEPFQEDLAESESMRLQYARKQLAVGKVAGGAGIDV